MKIILLMAMFLAPGLITAQNDVAEYFSGYAQEIGGKRFTYHSPFPDVSAALIMRGQAGYEPIRWLTEIVPSSCDEDFVTFIWLYSMDTDPEPVPFILSVNGKEWVRFSSPLVSEIGTRSIVGREGAELKFSVTMLDVNKDEMGFAILKIPTSAIKPGEAAILEIAAEPVQDDSWFMTYKTGVSEKINLYQNKVVVKDGDQLLHSLSVDIVHLGDDAPCSVQIGSRRT